MSKNWERTVPVKDAKDWLVLSCRHTTAKQIDRLNALNGAFTFCGQVNSRLVWRVNPDSVYTRLDIPAYYDFYQMVTYELPSGPIVRVYVQRKWCDEDPEYVDQDHSMVQFYNGETHEWEEVQKFKDERLIL